MDLATLIGLLGAFAIVGSAIVLGGDPMTFMNIPSMLIVFLGSLMVVLIKFGIGQFFGAIKVAIKAFMFKLDTPEELIQKSIELADAARKGGLLSLEEMEVSNSFLKKGIGYLVDGLDADVVRTMLVKDMNLTVMRHQWGQKIFKALGDVGPAMGMIGTLIGLVQMLSAMDDPKSIGPAMAVALLTTLYGAILATMIALPIADKLALRSEEEQQIKSLMIDALIGIQSGHNPRVIEEMLKQYLPPTKRTTAEEPA